MSDAHGSGIAFYHPANEDEVITLVRKARSEGALLRVQGSGHSVDDAILAGAPGAHQVLLDRMIGVRFDDATMRVTVQAGCHLGRDPSDPTKTSTWENGLFPQMDAHGWAVPDMGGIIHQSVGGFLSTGSAGGSLFNSIYDAIVAVRLVDGTGRVRTFHRDEGGADNPFHAVIPSMGLLGVITEVTFQCIRVTMSSAKRRRSIWRTRLWISSAMDRPACARGPSAPSTSASCGGHRRASTGSRSGKRAG
ncbi:MAG: FAD-binding protein [Gemmatimonadetes bacterium]|nr:FAD-binding protein [Gemmatimonadota bacterium]